MKYIINNMVLFEPDNEIIKDITGELEPIKLTTTQSRLLVFFIENNNKVLDKSIILKSVWQAHNQVDSDNNLYTAISILRRSFNVFGLEEIISTVPKIGFKFSSEITNDKETNLATELNDSSVVFHEQHGERKNNKKVIFIIIIIITFYFIFILFYFFSERDYSENYEYIGRIKKCNINHITIYRKQDISKLELSDVKKGLEKKGVNCDVESTIYFYDTKYMSGFYDNPSQSIYFFYCRKRDDGLTFCENFHDFKSSL